MSEQRVHTRSVRIVRADGARQIVYGEVYAPYRIDTQGEMMLPEDVELMAHRFLRLDLSRVVDVQHDNTPIRAFPVESFIARPNDPDFTPGAWVVGVKIEDPQVWQAVVDGRINAFSFEAFVFYEEAEVERLYQPDRIGRTERAQDGHDHLFFVRLDPEDRVLVGATSPGPDGHVHRIVKLSVTEPAADGHSHRYFL